MTLPLMEKIKFMSDEFQEEVDFFVLEQTKVNGVNYILVTEELVIFQNSGQMQKRQRRFLDGRLREH